MGVFWSATDAKFCAGWNAPWFVALVANKKREYLARLEIREPFPMTLPITVLVEPYYDEALAGQIAAEVKEKVKEKVYPISHVQRHWDFATNQWILEEKKPDRDAFDIEVQELVKDFVEKNGRNPTKKERKEIRQRVKNWSGNGETRGNVDQEWVDAMEREFKTERGYPYEDDASWCGI